jgi:hypothetical protein
MDSRVESSRDAFYDRHDRQRRDKRRHGANAKSASAKEEDLKRHIQKQQNLRRCKLVSEKLLQTNLRHFVVDDYVATQRDLEILAVNRKQQQLEEFYEHCQWAERAERRSLDR